MHTIHNRKDLYFALAFIHIAERSLQEQAASYTPEASQAMKDNLIDWKREARRYMRRERESLADLPRLVKNDGIDGYTVLLPLPQNLANADQAEAWFLDNEYMEYIPTYYDCTGQLSTSWYKIIQKNGRYYAYHSISRDC